MYHPILDKQPAFLRTADAVSVKSSLVVVMLLVVVSFSTFRRVNPFPGRNGRSDITCRVLIVRWHLSALTGLIWTDVRQARRPDLHAKLIYIIESPEQ